MGVKKSVPNESNNKTQSVTKCVEGLKELVMLRIDGLEQLFDERFNNVDQRSKNENKALILNAEEIQRRLSELNGEASRLRLMQETYLPRELYEANTKEQRITNEIHSKFINNAQGRQTVITVIVSTVVSFLLVALAKVLGIT